MPPSSTFVYKRGTGNTDVCCSFSGRRAWRGAISGMTTCPDCGQMGRGLRFTCDFAREPYGTWVLKMLFVHSSWRTPCIDQFCNGVNSIGNLWDMSTNHPNAFKLVFCRETTSLSYDLISQVPELVLHCVVVSPIKQPGKRLHNKTFEKSNFRRVKLLCKFFNDRFIYVEFHLHHF